MSQHDFDIANQGFAAFRSDLNNALQALASLSSGATTPTTTYANQLWYETDTNTLQLRNEANSAWLSLMVIEGSTGALTLAFDDGTAAAPSISNTGDTNTGLFFAAADTLAVTTGGTERMRVSSSGNVTAGSSTTSIDLEIGGTIKLIAATTEGRGIEVGQGRTGDGASYIDLISDATYTDYGFRIIRNNTGANTNTSITHRGTGSLQISTEEVAPIIFRTNLTERMRVDYNGYVGIGTNAPSFLVQAAVNSATGNRQMGLTETTYTTNFRAAYSSLYGVTAAGTTYGISNANLGLFVFQNLSAGVIATNDTAPIIIVTNSLERVRINSAGNVGIGNTSPVTPLHVTGAAMTTGVVYKAQPDPNTRAAAATLTIANLLTGIIQYTGGSATLTLPTGTLIEGGLPATFPVDMSFDVSFINTGAGTLTIGTAAGLTLVGTMTVATLTSAFLRFRKTAANAYTAYRIS